MLAVQECYLSVCKEKDSLEEHMRNREKEEALIRDNEVCVCVCGIKMCLQTVVYTHQTVNIIENIQIHYCRVSTDLELINIMIFYFYDSLFKAVLQAFWQ